MQKFLRILQAKSVVFSQGFLLSSLGTYLYILADKNSSWIFIFSIILIAVIIVSIYFFLFARQTQEELETAKASFMFGLTGGFIFVWSNFLIYILLNSH